MKYKSLGIVCVALMAYVYGAKAQSLSELDKDLQLTRIGLIDEFFQRFNCKEIHPMLNKEKNCRLTNMMMLFDLSQYKSKKDKKYLEAEEMINKAIEDSISINYSDTTWIAEATCHGSLKGKSVDFTLYLTVENRGKDMFKWSITKAESTLFNIAMKDSTAFLLPDDHETNFISLGRLTNEQPNNVHSFIRNQPKVNPTLVFETLVAYNILKIEYVSNLRFIFTQIPGYIFHLSYFDRQTYNSGWLISSFEKISKEQKDSFLNKIYE